MTRELTGHKVNGLNEALKIQVLDEPRSGVACHRYHTMMVVYAPPPKDVLLAIVEDRLDCFTHGTAWPVVSRGQAKSEEMT